MVINPIFDGPRGTIVLWDKDKNILTGNFNGKMEIIINL
jgi:hypothetical protein